MQQQTSKIQPKILPHSLVATISLTVSAALLPSTLVAAEKRPSPACTTAEYFKNDASSIPTLLAIIEDIEKHDEAAKHDIAR